MKASLVLLVLALVGGALARPAEEGKRLIQFSEDRPGRWLTLDEVDALASADVNFMDITDHQVVDRTNPPKVFAIPTAARFQSSVQAAIAKLSVARVEEFMVPFTTYHNRYYTAQTGIDASSFLLAQIEASIESSGYPGTATAALYPHANWAQPSVIATIHGTDASAPNSVVVLGAHMDSIASGGASGKAPGADDNASGSTTILEALRAILDSGFVPKTTIEFQWYAAEEVGLRGSADIVDKYKTAGRDVVGMVNFDMTGFLTSDTRIAIITDYTDPELSQFLRVNVDAYNNYPWANTRCGYACSDHASWHRGGFRAAHPHEGMRTSPYLHTTSDTLSNMNYARILELSRLATAYAIELAEPGN